MMTLDSESVVSASQPVSGHKRKSSEELVPSSQPTYPRRGRSKSMKLNPSIITLENLHQHDKANLILKTLNDIKSSQHTLVQRIDEIDNKVNCINQVVSEMKESFITKAPPISSEIILESIQNDLRQVKENLKLVPATVTDLNVTEEALMEMGEPQAEQNPQPENPQPVNNRIADIIPDLDAKINGRKHAFYKFIHNRDRLSIHQGWMELETPFIPPRFVPKKLGHGETEAEYQVRKQQKLKDLEAYLELLRIRRDEGKASFENVDVQVQLLINEADITEEEKLSVIDVYATKVAAEEAKSIKRWEKGKQGVEGVLNRSSHKILKEDERVYTAASKRKKGRKKKPVAALNTNLANKEKEHFSSHQPLPLKYADFSVPPPHVNLNRYTARTS